jgi:hypothetical protein
MSFEVIAKRGQRQFRVEEGAELMPDDALRFVVTVGMPGYLAVFSIDSRSRISAFYPDSDATKNAEPMLLQRKGRHELPGSIILDQVHGDECIVVAFSERPFDRSQVQQQARQARWFQQMGSPNESNTDSDIKLDVLWVKKK